MRRTRQVPVRLGVLMAAVVLVVAACSGDDDGADAGGAAEGGSSSAAADGAQGGGDGEAAAAQDAAAVPSGGCDGAATDQADLAEQTMRLDGAERRWLLSAPAWDTGDEPLPLVIDFHGLAEGADIHAQMTQLGPLGVDEGFVMVAPNATGSPVLWDVDPVVANNADLGFVEALLDRVEAERCIDTSRVYAAGLSNGAMMASTVACALSDRIAAFAAVSGIALPEGCDPSHPMPVLAFHGTADPILYFNGGLGSLITGGFGGGGGGGGSGAATTTTAALPPADLEGDGYPDTVRRWAELEGCDDTFEDEDVSDSVIRRTYDCPDNAPVEFVIVEGGGHSWPSSEFSKSIEQIVGPTTFDIDASKEIWTFFQRFHLPSG
jgi:polyhydroxybutyrate depolymerase